MQPYRIEMSGLVRSQFEALARASGRAGRAGEVSRATRQIIQLLSVTPLGVGDPMYRLRRARLRIRHLIVFPLYVEYGVHESEPVVHIRGVASLHSPMGRPDSPGH